MLGKQYAAPYAKSMSDAYAGTIEQLIALWQSLGEFESIKRVTKLPSGVRESDSHHSFALALTAYELAASHAPELDAHKVLLYALVHDLPELETGDVNTLLTSSEELRTKAKTDRTALNATRQRFAGQPHLLAALEAYETKADAESRFVYWIDKLMTVLTHFADNGQNLKSLGIHHQGDIEKWYERLLEKLERGGAGHELAQSVLAAAYRKMHDELLPPATASSS